MEDLLNEWNLDAYFKVLSAQRAIIQVSDRLSNVLV